MVFDGVPETILDGVKDLDPTEVGTTLHALARGEAVEADAALLRLAWLTLVREPIVYESGLVMSAMSIDTLIAGVTSLDEYLDDRRAFAGHLGVVCRPDTADVLNWAANYPNVLQTSVPDLHALIAVPLAALRHTEPPALDGVSPTVRAWLETRYATPQTAVEVLALAEIYRQSDDPDTAETLLEAGAATHQDPALYEAWGRLALAERDFATARDRLQAAMERDPSENLSLWHDLAWAAMNAGDTEQALALFDRVLAVDSEHLSTYSNRAYLYASVLNRPEDALADLDRLVALDPEEADAYYNRAHALQRLGRLDEAEADYEFALALYPDYAGAHYNLAMIHRDRGDLEAALDGASNALAIEDSAHFRRGRAEVLTQLDRLEDAVYDLTEAVAIQPHTSLFSMRAALFQQLGKNWRAISDSLLVLRYSPSASEQTNEAQTRLQALGYAGPTQYPWPERPEAMVLEGSTLEAQGDDEGAAQAYHSALTLDPGQPDALYNLGSLHLRRQNLDDAISVLGQAVEVSPHDHQALLNRGTALLQKAFTTEDPVGELLSAAATDFRQAIRTKSDYPSGYVKLGMMEGLEGRTWSGITLLLVARSLSQNHPQQVAAIDAQLEQLWSGADPAESGEPVGHILRWVLRLDLLQPVVDVSNALLDRALPNDATVLVHMAAAYMLAGVDYEEQAERLVEEAYAVSPKASAVAVDHCAREVIGDDFRLLLPA